MREPLPLHRVQEAILEFCRGRTDVAVFGAQAVNAYVDDPRMTKDVDLMATEPEAIAKELATALHLRFHVAMRTRTVHEGVAYRVYQHRSEGSRHLADVRLAPFPIEETEERDGIRYPSPAALVALKAIAIARRRNAPKGATDLADLRRLLLAFPTLRAVRGQVSDAIARLGGREADLASWHELVAAPLVSDDEADEGY